MTEFTFYPRDPLRQRAEIHADAAAGEELASRVAQRVQGAIGPAPDVPPHPRLTRGTHLDELHAVQDAVEDHLRELSRLTGEIQKVEREVARLRSLYLRLGAVGGVIALVVILILLVVVLMHR